MIIIDTKLKELERENRPIKVAMVGAGFFGRGLALQLQTAARGMKLVAISNRTLTKARNAFGSAGIEDIVEVASREELDRQICHGRACITNNPFLLCESTEIDVLVEATGTVQFSVEVILAAIQHKKHVVVNAELDATVGPILKAYADQHKVIYTGIDGDQPGVIMNLYRFLTSAGFKPVLCGNIKGLQDPYRNPTTQRAFAQKWGQTPAMVTSFADGSKISFEQAIIANATGMKVGKRGMHGPTVEAGTPIEEAIKEFPDELLEIENGVVDYVVGASPGPGIFIIARHDHPIQQHYLKLYKLGDGPYYCFYRPFHLCHFEVPNTIARAVLFNDATIAPLKSSVDVVTVAKKDLQAGQRLDGIGHYMTYGVCENMEKVISENLLPLGVAEGCILKTDIKKDEALSYDEVEVPEGRLIDRLRNEQMEHFLGKSPVKSRI